MIEKWDLYLGMSIAGIFTGLGSALGTYLANKHIIERMEKIKRNRFKRK